MNALKDALAALDKASEAVQALYRHASTTELYDDYRTAEEADNELRWLYDEVVAAARDII